MAAVFRERERSVLPGRRQRDAASRHRGQIEFRERRTGRTVASERRVQGSPTLGDGGHGGELAEDGEGDPNSLDVAER